MARTTRFFNFHVVLATLKYSIIMNGKIVNSEEHSKKCNSLRFTSRKKENVTKKVIGGTVMLYEERVLTCKDCGFKIHISLKYKSEKENLKKNLEKDFKYAVFLLRQTHISCI